MPESFWRGRRADESWATTARLSSGRIKGSYPARGGFEGDFGPHLQGEISVQDPVMAEFARTGRIVVNGYPQYGSSAADLTAVQGFMAACARQRGS